MSYLSQEKMEYLLARYPQGTRIELVHMDDPDPIPVGTQGTIVGINSMGDLEVAWDNGRSLSLIFGQDRCRILSAPGGSDFVKK